MVYVHPLYNHIHLFLLARLATKVLNFASKMGLAYIVENSEVGLEIKL